MGFGFQTQILLFFFSIIIFLFSNGVMIRALDLKQKPSEFYWLEENGVVAKESQVQKVSGDDQSEEEGSGVLQRSVVFENFRVLLGLQRSGKLLGHGENGFSPAPAPTPVLPSFTHFKTHPPHYHVTPIASHDLRVGRRRKENGDKIRRIVIAIVVTIVATFLIFALVIFAIQRIGRKWENRSKKTNLVSSINGGSGRFKFPNLPNSVNKVSFDPGPEFFYLNALGPLSEKQSFEPAPIFCNENPQISSIEEGETINHESDESSCSSGIEILPLEECDSSGDESFHSICNSNSSNTRISNACEVESGATSPVPSPTVNSPKISHAALPHRSPTKTPTSRGSDFIPPLLVDSDSSHSCSSSGSEKFPLTDLPSPCDQTSFPFSPSNLQSSSCSSISISRPKNPTLPTSLLSSTSPPQFSATRVVSHGTTPCPPGPPLLLSPPSPFLKRSNSIRPQLAPPCQFQQTGKDGSPLTNLKSSSGSSISISSPKKPIPPASLISSTSPPQFSAMSLVSNGTTLRPPAPPLPPCPPPPFPKGSNSIRPPPAPPCQLQQTGKDGSPLPKLKPLHWDKVRAAPDRSMVWDKIRSSSFELDEEMIESLFGYNLQSSKNEETKSKSSPPSKHVLDSKRLQNLTILSKALNASAEEISGALMRGEGLSVEQLEALVKMSPTKEEEQKLTNYPGDINELGSAEKFVKAILDIPYAFLRIEAMLYRETFEDEVVYLKKSFAMLEEACKELKSSRLFLKLLEAVLKTGNRMNVGTIRGGARAFKLDALLKLADVKGTDGKTTLLHFVVQEMIRSEGARASEITIVKDNHENKSKTVEESDEHYRNLGLDHVSGLSSELCNVKKTASIDLDVLASSVSNLSDGMIKLKHLTNEESLMGGRREFVVSMRSFLKFAQYNIKELQEDENRVISLIREITVYFHGDLSKDEVNPLRIFVIVRDFLGMLDRVCKEIRCVQSHNSPNSSLSFR